MKLEHITENDMLVSYLTVNYESRDTLVVKLDNHCPRQEFVALMKDLDSMGHLPPKNWRAPGATLIMEMPWSSACKIVTDHSGGKISIAAYRGGKLLSTTAKEGA